MSPLTGGCLCGAVRYQTTATPIDAGYCHCRLCQKANGAPVVTWLTVPFEEFTFIKGNPTAYRSSPVGIRHFCQTCGTHLTFQKAQEPITIDIIVCSMDDSEAIQPQYHVWTASQITWFEVADNLPRYQDEGPDI
ncbi:MAG TPA: GFA family protein [Cyanobacteria bacterium UBA8553]|nr:GFA family protein [Cyanobacteria bacterium UBA8553]